MGQDGLDHAVRARDDVDAEELAHALGGRGAGVGGSLDGAHVAADEDGDEAAADALAAMKQFAEAHFRRVDTAVRREDDQYIVSFSASDAPREDSLLFGLGCLNLRTEYARALPGSLRRIADGRWEAAFNAKDVFCVEVGAGVYECFLGGVMENGLSFAGMALVKYELD